MFKKGGPSNGTPLPEWSISDDGLGMLTGTLKVFLDGNPAMGGRRSGSNLPSQLGTSSFTQYSGNNGLTNPIKPASGGGLGAGIPKTGDAHPFDSRLTCFGVSVSRNSMGYGYAEAQYVGLLSDPAGIEWEITCPTEEDAIETHPRFLIKDRQAYDPKTGKPVPSTDKGGVSGGDFGTITSNGINPQTKGPYWNLSNVHIDGPTQSFKGFRASDEIIKKNLVGVESYKVPRSTYRVSYTTSKVGYFTWALNSLGHIFSSIPDFINKGLGQSSSVWSNEPATPAGLAKGVSSLAGKENFLMTSVSVSQASGLYKVSIEFTRSGPYGWNPIIYMDYDPKALDKAISDNSVSSKK